MFRNYDDYLLDVEMVMSLWECYKNFVDCFYNFDNWFGKDAKWIDLCYASSQEDMDLFTKQWQYTESTKYYVGNGKNSTDCWKLPITSGGAYGSSDQFNILGRVQDHLVKYTINKMLS